MSDRLEKIDRRIERGKRMLNELLDQKKSCESAIRLQQREEAERVAKRRRQAVLRVAESAKLDEFSPVEVLGMLLDAKDRARQSPTVRMAVRKRGEEWLANVSRRSGQRPNQTDSDAAA